MQFLGFFEMTSTPEQIFKLKKINGLINADFNWNEFIKPVDGIPTLEQLNNIKKTADVLSIYKHKVFEGKKITVTCGFRSMAHHLKIYAEKGITDKSKIPMKSYHLSGLAVDFVVEGFTVSQLFRLMDVAHFGGVERTDGNWQHIDLRNSICRFTTAGVILQPHYNMSQHNRIFHS